MTKRVGLLLLAIGAVALVARAGTIRPKFCATKDPGPTCYTLPSGQIACACLARGPTGANLGTTDSAKADDEDCAYCHAAKNAAMAALAAQKAANPALPGCQYDDDAGVIYCVGFKRRTPIRWDVATGTVKQVSAVPTEYAAAPPVVGAPVADSAAIVETASVAEYTPPPDFKTLDENADFTAQAGVYYDVDTAKGDVAVTLPDPVAGKGQTIAIKKIAAAGQIVIVGTVDGKTLASATQWSTTKLISNGATWEVF